MLLAKAEVNVKRLLLLQSEYNVCRSLVSYTAPPSRLRDGQVAKRSALLVTLDIFYS
jgi:hypothetical protein